MSTSGTRRAWLEIDEGALCANLRALKGALGPSVHIIPMVKADGYGLGMLDVVRVLESEGIWGWGVATVGEGISLREAGVRSPIVVFTPVVKQDIADAVGQSHNRSCRGGVDPSTSLTRKKSRLLRCSSVNDVSASRSNVSPGSSSMSPIFLRIRCPSRATAMTAAL